MKSSGPRNLAANLWFVPLLFFNTSDCARWTEPLPDYANLSSYRFLTAEKLDYTESLVRCGTFSIWSVDDKVLGLSSMYLASCILLSGKGGGVVTFDVTKLTRIPCPHICFRSGVESQGVTFLSWNQSSKAISIQEKT